MALGLAAAPLAAQPLAAEPERGAGIAGSPPGPSCDEGLVKDDGTIETGWGWVPSVIRGEYVQQFNSGELPSRYLDKVCLCFLRTRDDDDLDFDVVMYRDAGGYPDRTPIATARGQVRDLPQGVANGQFVEVDLHGMEVPAGTFYLGARWNGMVDQFFFVCADTTPTTPRTNLWWTDDRATDWDNAFQTTDPIFAPHRAALIRPVAGPPIVGVDVPVGANALALLATLLAGAGLIRLWRA